MHEGLVHHAAPPEAVRRVGGPPGGGGFVRAVRGKLLDQLGQPRLEKGLQCLARLGIALPLLGCAPFTQPAHDLPVQAADVPDDLTDRPPGTGRHRCFGGRRVQHPAEQAALDAQCVEQPALVDRAVLTRHGLPR